MTSNRLQYYAENKDELFRRDRLFLNNPVIMSGMGLAPLVVVCSSLKNAVIVCAAVMLMLTPIRMLAALFSRTALFRFKGVSYILTSALVYAGTLWVLQRVFTTADLLLLGIYLPLLVAEPLIIKRYERPQKERLRTAFAKGLRTSLGFVLVAVLVGALREFLSFGSLYGYALIEFKLFPLAAQPAGGFIILAIIMALWRGRVRMFKREVEQEVSMLDE